jgi:hypothetical protein
VNVRSVLIGLLGVVLISTLTPYNDLVLRNTYLIGNFLPVGLLLFLMLLIMLINAPLYRWARHRALTSGELAVIVGMILVGCSIPSSGVMRYLMAQLVAPWYHSGVSVEYARLMEALNLPDWIFPRFSEGADTVAARATDPVVVGAWNRLPVDHNTFAERFMAVPWSAWVRPALVWSIPVGALMGAVLCLMVIVRRQWVENERLTFPIADLYLSLIETPRPGHALNSLFRSGSFWVGFCAVFVIHGSMGLHQYVPEVPLVPISYDFSRLLVDDPWTRVQGLAKANTTYFCVVGITYYLRSNVSLSLWLSYILFQVSLMAMGSAQLEFTGPMQDDQRLGMLLPFTLMILWIGRSHWAMVIRHMALRRPASTSDDGERYLPYFIAGWGLVGCAAVVVLWLWVAGATFVGGVLIVTMALLLFLIVARVVAETGLIFVQVMVPIHRPFLYAMDGLPAGLSARTSLKTFYYSAMFNLVFVHDQRESLAGFAPNAIRVADSAAYGDSRGWRRTIPFFGCLVIALGVAFVVGGMSMLYTDYSYSTTQDQFQATPINSYAIDSGARAHVLTPSYDYMVGRSSGESHSRWTHFGIGAGLTSVLAWLRLSFVWWPLHPVGYLLAFSYPIRRIWFSIMLGWLAKVLIVRFGGSRLFLAAKPLFTGLILGEATAAAFWLIVCLMRNAMGLEFHIVNFLPG